MSKHKLKIRLSPKEKGYLAGVPLATKGAAEENVQKILLDFLADVQERRAKQSPSLEASNDVAPNSLALEQLETDARKATKSRLDAKHEIAGVGEGLQQFLQRQAIDLTSTNVADELAKRKGSETVSAGIGKFSDAVRKLIFAGGKILLSVGSLVIERAID